MQHPGRESQFETIKRGTRRGFRFLGGRGKMAFAALPPKQNYDVHWSKWPDYLTPDRERHFKRAGEKLVFRGFAERRYQEPEKYFAAIYWLGKQAERRDKRIDLTLRIAQLTLLVASLTLLASIVSTCTQG